MNILIIQDKADQLKTLTDLICSNEHHLSEGEFARVNQSIEFLLDETISSVVSQVVQHPNIHEAAAGIIRSYEFVTCPICDQRLQLKDTHPSFDGEQNVCARCVEVW